MRKKIKIGIDLGGSHISVGIVKNGKIVELFEKDFTVEEKQNVLNVAIDFICENINGLKQKYKFTRCGIGMAGSISNGKILRSVNLNAENFDLAKTLKDRTGINFIIKNDAKCAGIAECKYGLGVGKSSVLFLTLGTGIGGAYFLNSKLVEGFGYDGFEYGHMVINSDGILCKCGKKGCFEQYGSLLAYKSKVIDRLGFSHNIPGAELREQIKIHQNEVQDIKRDYIKNLALGISNLINIFEPECIILGGGFARYESLLMQDLKYELLNENLLFNKRSDIQIFAAKLGNDAGIIGASEL